MMHDDRYTYYVLPPQGIRVGRIRHDWLVVRWTYRRGVFCVVAVAPTHEEAKDARDEREARRERFGWFKWALDMYENVRY